MAAAISASLGGILKGQSKWDFIPIHRNLSATNENAAHFA